MSDSAENDALPAHQDYGEPCGHRAAYDSVVIHTRSATPVGPDYCAECSEAIQEWVAWPCPRAKAHIQGRDIS